MSSINTITIVGRLGADPELKYTPQGKAVCTFRLAVDRRTKGEADWIPVVAWDKLAEVCGQYLRRGKQVAINGRLQTRTYEKDGQKRTAFDVVANDMQMLGSRDDDGAEPQRQQPPHQPQQRPMRHAVGGGHQAAQATFSGGHGGNEDLGMDDVPF